MSEKAATRLIAAAQEARVIMDARAQAMADGYQAGFVAGARAAAELGDTLVLTTKGLTLVKALAELEAMPAVIRAFADKAFADKPEGAA